MDDNIIKMVSVASDAIFNPLLDVVHNTLQPQLINGQDFLTNGILKLPNKL